MLARMLFGQVYFHLGKSTALKKVDASTKKGENRVVRCDVQVTLVILDLLCEYSECLFAAKKFRTHQSLM